MIFWKPQQIQQEKGKKKDGGSPKQDNYHLSKRKFLFPVYNKSHLQAYWWDNEQERLFLNWVRNVLHVFSSRWETLKLDFPILQALYNYFSNLGLWCISRLGRRLWQWRVQVLILCCLLPQSWVDFLVVESHFLKKIFFKIGYNWFIMFKFLLGYNWFTMF